jgi:hypothetical protein
MNDEAIPKHAAIKLANPAEGNPIISILKVSTP